MIKVFCKGCRKIHDVSEKTINLFNATKYGELPAFYLCPAGTHGAISDAEKREIETLHRIGKLTSLSFNVHRDK